jgi:hypothetical protein
MIAHRQDLRVFLWLLHRLPSVCLLSMLLLSLRRLAWACFGAGVIRDLADTTVMVLHLGLLIVALGASFEGLSFEPFLLLSETLLFVPFVVWFGKSIGQVEKVLWHTNGVK